MGAHKLRFFHSVLYFYPQEVSSESSGIPVKCFTVDSLFRSKASNFLDLLHVLYQNTSLVYLIIPKDNLFLISAVFSRTGNPLQGIQHPRVSEVVAQSSRRRGASA